MAEIQRTTELTAKDCRGMITRLSEAVAELEAAAVQMERENTKSIWVFKVASYRVATEKLAPFVEELRKSRLLLAEGRPQGASTSKTRGVKTVKKATKRKKPQ